MKYLLFLITLVFLFSGCEEKQTKETTTTQAVEQTPKIKIIEGEK